MRFPWDTSSEEEPTLPLVQNRFVNPQQVKSPLKKIAKKEPMQTPSKLKNKRSKEMELFLASQNQEVKEQFKINLEQKEVIFL